MMGIFQTWQTLRQNPPGCSIRKGDWKLIEFERNTDAGPRTLVESRWKLTVFPPSGQGLLFDLENDPQEINNLWDDNQYRSKKSRLILRLLEELAMSDRIDDQKLSPT